MGVQASLNSRIFHEVSFSLFKNITDGEKCKL